MTSEIRVGLQFKRMNKNYRIAETRIAHDKLVCEAEDGDLFHMAPSQFRAEIVDELINVLVPSSNGVLVPLPNNWRERETARAHTMRDQRQEILNIEARELKCGKTMKEAQKTIRAHCLEQRFRIPCERTLRNWRSRLQQHECKLSPQWQNCGNRKQGPDEVLFQAMEEVVEHTILSNDRFTLTAAWKTILARYEQLCLQAQVSPKAVSIRQLSRYVRAMSSKMLTRARVDPRLASALTRTAVHLHSADILWESVEMDAAFLNVLIRDDEGTEIGRPVMYAAIDVCTGYPVGLHFTLQRPSALPFIDCLRYMYFPKPEGFDENYGIQHRVEVYAKPAELKMDNGSEFIGQHSLEMVRQLFGDAAHCKPYTPQEKPHVERFNATVKQFCRTLPGSVTSAVIKVSRTPSKNEKLLTLEELKGRLFRFIYDDYALQTNEIRSWKSRKAVAPLDIVNEIRSQFLDPIPVSREEFERTMFFKHTHRTVNSSGAPFDGFIYHSDELAGVYGQHGHGKYEILYSELDAEMIYAIPPGGGTAVAAFAKELSGLKMDRATAKQFKAEMTAEGKILNQRAYKQKLAEFETIKVNAKSSQGRGQQARKKDLLVQAATAVRPTMPGSKSTVPGNLEAPESTSTWNFENTGPTGRMRGDK